MNKKMMSNVYFAAVISLFLCSIQLTYAKGKPQGKTGRGERSGWMEGKRAGQSGKKRRGGAGKHRGWDKEKKAGRKKGTPPGWKKGLKKGWRNSTPPGWNKLDKKAKKKWKKDLAAAKKGIKTRARRRGWGAKDREKAAMALEFAARKGVPPGQAGKIIGNCVESGLNGEETLRVGVAISERAGKGQDFETLGSQITEKLKAGYRGEKLAEEINAIETRHKAKMKAQPQKTGEPGKGKKEKPDKIEKQERVKKK